MHVHQDRHQPVPPHNLSMDRIPPPPQRPMYNAPASSTLPPGQGPPAGPPAGPTPTPQSTSAVDENNRRYTLQVAQQPIRARMCGFGDKDRRPITPPPCILLTVADATTGAPLDINEIDVTYYVLSVDLWAPDGSKEVNLVRHSATSPSISATTSSSYPPPPTPPPSFPFGVPMTQVHVGLTQGAYAQNGQYAYPRPDHYQQSIPPYSHANIASAAPGGGPPQPGQDQAAVQQSQSYYTTNAGAPITPTHYYTSGGPAMGSLLSPTPPGMPVTQDPRSAPSGMFTRNLIGSLVVSAFKLTDPDGQMGIWFILQDLSVRTEGSFRLKMNFVNVGSSETPGSPSHLNMGTAPILASCFSNVFQVFSAKKFPGVIESTPLSKCFATQGIKIPIRKDGPGRREDEEE